MGKKYTDMNQKVKKDFFFLLLVILFTTLPFLNKPFNIDDAQYFEIASWIDINPFNVAKHDFGWLGQQIKGGLIYETSHPILFFYFLNVISKIGHANSEAIYHLIYIFFPILIAVSFYFIAAKFIEKPLYAVLLLLAMPGYLACSHTIMADSPTLSFWLSAVCLYIYGLDGRKKCLYLTMVPVFFALGFSYQSLSLIPLLLFWALIKRQISWKTLLPVIIPAGIFFGYLAIIYKMHGVFPFFANIRDYNIKNLILSPNYSQTLGLKTIYIFSSVGSMLLIPSILFLSMELKASKGKLIILGGVIFCFLISLEFISDYSFFYKFLFSIYFISGFFIIVKSFSGLKKNLKIYGKNMDAMAPFFSVWCLGIIFYNIFIMPMGAIRFLLPLFPPLILLFLKKFEIDTKWRHQKKILVVFFAQMAFSLSVARADYEFASIYKDFSKTIPTLVSEKDHDIYFSGEWGFRYYMKKEGYIYFLNEHHSPKTGDFIIQPTLAYFEQRPESVASRLKLIKTKDYKGDIPLRLFNFEAKGGFWSHDHGLLPISIGNNIIESFKIYQVS
ncbi:MAG: glycosyltransferase family 39 protein [Nitrospinae bacterium]|nr:glycosyltransferase family 39 protein [Nitrospinota bacterium]